MRNHHLNILFNWLFIIICSSLVSTANTYLTENTTWAGDLTAVNWASQAWADVDSDDDPPRFLSPNTWYQVDLTSDIKAIGGYNESGEMSGDSLEPFIWRFKTKNDNSLCVINRVEVNPPSFVARAVNEKTFYNAYSFSAPDSCSRFGQMIDPWLYGWTWTTGDPNVATVSNFASGGSHAGWCSGSCVPKGSDILRAETAPPLCGNGTVEAGEDCDSPSATCGFDCLFIPRINIGSVPADEFVGVGAGGVSVCGDGAVTAGED